MRDRFINHHGLNNLIWVWSYGKNAIDSAWYPGNDKVDLLGFDNYPGKFNYDCNYNVFGKLGSLSKWQKLLALTEVGPIPDVQKCWS